jgi:hypothetical protein
MVALIPVAVQVVVAWHLVLLMLHQVKLSRQLQLGLEEQVIQLALGLEVRQVLVL